MKEGSLDMAEVTIELDEADLEEIDRKAFVDHRGNREAAIRSLLDEWLKGRD